ncbi:sensor histidine kinase [Serpentinicella alkaliphila]|uniref:sensor histidine kinase n=1 Tax=Serpentinicella alkaliphila TaxID=1734049 RepID=UPI00104552C2|nr:HAMP domain-containing sensor histidine kinase [Serpentinicella alkaliphila]
MSHVIMTIILLSAIIIVDNWRGEADLEKITEYIKQSEITSEDKYLSLAIYEGDKEVYTFGDFSENTMIIAANESGKKFFTMDNFAIYSVEFGNYRVYLMNRAHKYGENDKIKGSGNSFAFDIVIIIGIVILANQLLNRMVFKSIIIPLDMLVDGVHEIRDGNLGCRIRYNGKDEFAGICMDFNNMAQKIQELMEAKRKDDENRRELIAGISHDLRTPLTSIKAYVEGLQKGVATTSHLQKEYLETIANKADDLEHIVKQLFLFSKLDIGDFPLVLKNIDIGKELKQYKKSVMVEYEKRGLQVHLQDAQEGITVRVDPIQLRNVFTNILENTLKYGLQEHGCIKINCMAAVEDVSIIFEDNGPGVQDDKLDKLFNAFYRTNRARSNPGQGSGLGLAISRKIIERFSGSIYAENVYGGGLKIVIVLPIVAGGSNEENIDY